MLAPLLSCFHFRCGVLFTVAGIDGDAVGNDIGVGAVDNVFIPRSFKSAVAVMSRNMRCASAAVPSAARLVIKVASRIAVFFFAASMPFEGDDEDDELAFAWLPEPAAEAAFTAAKAVAAEVAVACPVVFLLGDVHGDAQEPESVLFNHSVLGSATCSAAGSAFAVVLAVESVSASE